MGLDCCTWYWSYSTCLLHHFNSRASHMALYICQLNLSIHHMHFHHTAWTTHKVCMPIRRKENPMPWSSLHISSFSLHHFMLHLILESLPLLSGILGYPFLWKLNLYSLSIHIIYHNHHWTWFTWWIQPYPIFNTWLLMPSSSLVRCNE